MLRLNQMTAVAFSDILGFGLGFGVVALLTSLCIHVLLLSWLTVCLQIAEL